MMCDSFFGERKLLGGRKKKKSKKIIQMKKKNHTIFQNETTNKNEQTKNSSKTNPLLFVKGLDNLPEPLDNRRAGRVPFVNGVLFPVILI
jgi:hypothetical protein